MTNDINDKKKEQNEQPVDSIKSPEMVKIPSGPFLMGTSDEQIATLVENEEWADEWIADDLFQAEQPQHKLTLPSYEIGKFPVSNFEYFSFIYNTGYKVPKHWQGFRYNDGEANHPVSGVSKIDALKYCEWLSQSLQTQIRLPTEAEWEKAARGPDSRLYPWGDFFDPWRCNTLESAKRSTTPIGLYSPSGDSYYGIVDMVGNVFEWTSSFLHAYPYTENNGQEDNKKKCIVRGGAWYYSHKLARCAARENVLPDYVSPALGFRLARNISD